LFYELLKLNGFGDVKEFVPIHNKKFPNSFIDQSNVSKSLAGKRPITPGLKLAFEQLKQKTYVSDSIPSSPVGSPMVPTPVHQLSQK